MTKIQELLEKRAKAWEQAKAFLDSHRQENGLVSPEDTATYEKMEAEIVAYGKEIERLQRQEAMDRELSAPLSSPMTSRPGNDDVHDGTGRGSKAYDSSFWNMIRGNVTSDIKNSLNIGIDGDGGYLVPDEFDKQIVESLEDACEFRKHANVIRTSNGQHKIPIAASSGSAAWLEEEALIPETDETFSQVYLEAHKNGAIIKVSDELLNDSVFDIQSFIAKQFARKISAKEEEAFFTGNGVGKPVGILNAEGGAQVGVTTASADITFDDVMDLYYSLKAPYRNHAVFYLNDQTVKAIRKLKDANGNYLWQPSLQAGEPDKILNCPYFTTPYMPVAGADAKAIAFGDFSYYWIADREGFAFKRLNELFAATGQVGFIATERVDGKLILPEAVKVLQCGKASATASTK